MIRIKEIRKDKKITAKQLAEFVNVAESTMSLYENGKREPDYETLLKISEYLDVSIDYLLGKTDVKTEKPADEGELLSNYNATEKTLIEYFRQLDESDRFKVIQYTMNLCTEAEKKTSARLRELKAANKGEKILPLEIVQIHFRLRELERKSTY